MQRCLQLASLGAGYVAPNPMVGAVLVHEQRIIGEGYHQQSGEAHAEVNCFNSVSADHKHLIEHATLYVSLEPCAHFGKTPPCANLIIANKIPKVVIGCRDPFEEVNGKGIEKLKKAGIEVIAGVLENDCKQLNNRFFTHHTKQRPYIILKWAQSQDGKIANADSSRAFISNAYTNRLVHKWRSEEAAIMVGTNTALLDNPALNVRHWKGRNPVRLLLDMSLRLSASLHIFDRQQQTIVFNSIRQEESNNLLFYRFSKQPIIPQVLDACYQLKIQSVLVEGGSKLLQSFIDAGAWDEARVIENKMLTIDGGLQAPMLSNHKLVSHENIQTDTITYYHNASSV